MAGTERRVAGRMKDWMVGLLGRRQRELILLLLLTLSSPDSCYWWLVAAGLVVTAGLTSPSTRLTGV